MFTCQLCAEQVSTLELLEHVRLIHPDVYEPLEEWPDGGVVVRRHDVGRRGRSHGRPAMSDLPQIPDDAVVAATRGGMTRYVGPWIREDVARAVLADAGPHIHASALRRAAERFEAQAQQHLDAGRDSHVWHPAWAAQRLRSMADDITKET